MPKSSDAESFDVVIVGSGVAGALVADRMSANQYRVLVLEAGEGPVDGSRDELVARFASAQIKLPEAPYAAPAGVDPPLVQTPLSIADPYFDQVVPGAFRSNYERRVGGTTWHWLGNCPRHVPNDFSVRTNYGVGVDWPLGYAELEQWYVDAEAELGVSGNHEQWDGLLGGYRSAPFPMTEVWPTYSDQWVTAHLGQFEVDGVSIRPISTPQARNSAPYQGRPACAGNSSCVPICPIQAKYDATVHLKRATDAKADSRRTPAVLRSHAVVTRVVIGDDGQVSHVVYREWSGKRAGAEKTARGRAFVLAGNAIETPRLLLASSPEGVANSSTQVGSNLMDHLQGEVVCLTPEPVFGFRGPPTTSGIDGFRDGQFRSQHAPFRMSLGNDGWPRTEAPGATLAALLNEKQFGKELQESLRDRMTRQLRISYSTEVLPSPENKVSLSDDTDAFGVPRPRIAFHLSDYNVRGFRRARVVAGLIFAKLGASAISAGDDADSYYGAGHIMGTTRMGADPASSVVDSDCRTHDHQNLFVVGSSVFPTSGTANPTLTIAALALRTATKIHTQLGPT